MAENKKVKACKKVQAYIIEKANILSVAHVADQKMTG
jgi:hypothetical protein